MSLAEDKCRGKMVQTQSKRGTSCRFPRGTEPTGDRGNKTRISSRDYRGCNGRHLLTASCKHTRAVLWLLVSPGTSDISPCLRAEPRDQAIFNLPFCFREDPGRLDEACSHWGGQSAFLTLLPQRLISSKNTLGDTL